VSQKVLDTIRTRRVIRQMTDQPVKREQLEQILDAGRWAPSGGNLRLHRFVAVTDPLLLKLVRMFAPGMFQQPPALIVICTDWDQVARHELPKDNAMIYVDVGTAAENMMLAAHAIGLGSGPVTSFSQAGVKVVLNLPPNFTPEMIICVGHPAPKLSSGMSAYDPITWENLTFWNRFADQ
jgi:nitroreductase